MSQFETTPESRIWRYTFYWDKLKVNYCNLPKMLFKKLFLYSQSNIHSLKPIIRRHYLMILLFQIFLLQQIFLSFCQRKTNLKRWWYLFLPSKTLANFTLLLRRDYSTYQQEKTWVISKFQSYLWSHLISLRFTFIIPNMREMTWLCLPHQTKNSLHLKRF